MSKISIPYFQSIFASLFRQLKYDNSGDVESNLSRMRMWPLSLSDLSSSPWAQKSGLDLKI